MDNKPSSVQVAVSYNRKFSHTNFEDYYTIEFIDRDTGVLRKSYVSDNNRNYAMWQHLIAHMEDNPQSAVAIEGAFKCVRGKNNIINADVKFGHVQDFDRDQFMNAVVDVYYA